MPNATISSHRRQFLGGAALMLGGVLAGPSLAAGQSAA
jgi:hypothetical protein